MNDQEVQAALILLGFRYSNNVGCVWQLRRRKHENVICNKDNTYSYTPKLKDPYVRGKAEELFKLLEET